MGGFGTAGAWPLIVFSRGLSARAQHACAHSMRRGGTRRTRRIVGGVPCAEVGILLGSSECTLDTRKVPESVFVESNRVTHGGAMLSVGL